jgi:membrane protease YdiL (CAAX protease family)
VSEIANQSVDRSLPIWEIASVTTSCLIAEWVITAVVGMSHVLIAVPILLAFAFMFWSHRLRGESLRDLGFRFDNFGQAARRLLVPMMIASVVLIGVGYFNHNIDFFRWRGGGMELGMPLIGILWGLVQQYALQGFINRRAQLVWGRGVTSILIVSALFGIFHLPNPTLMAVTFVGGLVWATVYQKTPNLFALAISHGLMTWILISTVPSYLLHGLRVGYKFLG